VSASTYKAVMLANEGEGVDVFRMWHHMIKEMNINEVGIPSHTVTT
jgi:hypothetical protein